jgi:hypothetical protein
MLRYVVRWGRRRTVVLYMFRKYADATRQCCDCFSVQRAWRTLRNAFGNDQKASGTIFFFCMDDVASLSVHIHVVSMYVSARLGAPTCSVTTLQPGSFHWFVAKPAWTSVATCDVPQNGGLVGDLPPSTLFSRPTFKSRAKVGSIFVHFLDFELLKIRLARNLASGLPISVQSWPNFVKIPWQAFFKCCNAVVDYSVLWCLYRVVQQCMMQAVFLP